MKYCESCQQKVMPVKSPWSWWWFLAWMPLAGIVYIVYHFLLKRRTLCPICGTKDLSPVKQPAAAQ